MPLGVGLLFGCANRDVQVEVPKGRCDPLAPSSPLAQMRSN